MGELYYSGLTEEEFDAMYPNAGQGGAAEPVFDSPNQDVDAGPSTAGDGDAGQEDDPGDDDTGQKPDEQGNQESQENQRVDERGVPWKNRAKEYERKLREIEAKMQYVQGPENSFVQGTENRLPPLPVRELTSPRTGEGEQAGPKQQPSPLWPPPLDQSPKPDQKLFQPGQQPLWPGKAQAGQPGVAPTLDEFLALAEQRAEQRALQVIQQQQTEQRILSDYPDMLNPASPLFQWTQYELNTRYGSDPQFVEEATMRAASRLSIQPKQRQQTLLQGRDHKPLPRVNPPTPATERGRNAPRSSKVRLSEESMRAARAFGQNPKELEAMVKRQKYAFSTGAALFTEEENE